MPQCIRCKDIYGASEMAGSICKNCIKSPEEERQLKEDTKQKEQDKYNADKKRLEKIALLLIIYNFVLPIVLKVISSLSEFDYIVVIMLVIGICTIILALIFSLILGFKYKRWVYFRYVLLYHLLYFTYILFNH